MDQNALDLALLLLRLTLGVTLALHGVAKYRGGIAGVGRWFEGEGLKPGLVHAHLAALSEIGFGLALAIGLLVPFSAMGFAGVMAVAGWVGHRKNGFFIIKDGWEYVFVLAAAASCLSLTGPGSWSVDNAFGTELSGIGWFMCTVFGAIASAVGLLGVCYRPSGD